MGSIVINIYISYKLIDILFGDAEFSFFIKILVKFIIALIGLIVSELETRNWYYFNIIGFITLIL